MSLYYTLVCVVHICMCALIFISTHLYAHFIVEEERIEEGTAVELTRLQWKTGASQSDSHCIPQARVFPQLFGRGHCRLGQVPCYMVCVAKGFTGGRSLVVSEG